MIALSMRLIDPRTKQATAFYAALGITLWDIFRHGFQPLSVALLAGMAGLGALGALGFITRPPPPTE